MILGSVIQQPYERLDYDFDYSDFIPNDGLSHIEESPLDVNVRPSGLVVTPVLIEDHRVKLWISGGTAGVDYTVELTVTTSNGRIKQDELIVSIVDY